VRATSRRPLARRPYARATDAAGVHRVARAPRVARVVALATPLALALDAPALDARVAADAATTSINGESARDIVHHRARPIVAARRMRRRARV
jgi:hypothetical protein